MHARCERYQKPKFHGGEGGLVYISTAPTWVPIWGPGSPWGPFSDFGSPQGPHFFFKVPIFSILSLRTRERSVQPPSNDDHLIIRYKWHKDCALNDDTLWLCEFLKENIHFNELASFGHFLNIRFLGPHFCGRGSPFGPHFTKNWVPIRSPLKKFRSPFNVGAVVTV